MPQDERSTDTITVDCATVKVVEESRNREIMKAVRIVALGAVISWGAIAYNVGAGGWFRDDGSQWSNLVIFLGLCIALYGRRILDRARVGTFDQLATAAQKQEKKPDD